MPPRSQGRNLCVDVYCGDEIAFRAQIGTTGENNGNVIKGKMIIAKHFGTRCAG